MVIMIVNGSDESDNIDHYEITMIMIIKMIITSINKMIMIIMKKSY